MSFEAIEAVVDLHPRVLVVDDGLNPSAVASTAGRRIRALLSELKELNYKVLEAVSFPDALANVQSDASIVLLVVDWTLGKNTSGTHQQATGRRTTNTRQEASQLSIRARGGGRERD